MSKLPTRRQTLRRIVKPWVTFGAIGFVIVGGVVATIMFLQSRPSPQTKALFELGALGVIVRLDADRDEPIAYLSGEFDWPASAQQIGTAIKFFGGPVALDLSAATGVSDLSQISGLANLETLNLEDAGGVIDLGPLAGLTGLRSLDLENADGVTDLGPLAGLSNLEELDLGDVDRVTDLGPLAGLLRLETLELSSVPGLTDLGPLSGLTGLNSLDLSYSPGITDLAPLANLGNLETLYLIGAEGVGDLGPLSGLTKLQYLQLRERLRDEGNRLLESRPSDAVVLTIKYF